MLAHDTTPLWSEAAKLHALWAKSRTTGQSMALSVFLQHICDALHVGLIEVQVRSDYPASQAIDQIVVGEWHLSGDLDSLRTALQAPKVDVTVVVHQ